MKRLLVIAMILAATARHAAAQLDGSVVNFAHLRHLMERIVFSGDTVSIVHVYSNYPDFSWVDAKESGPEGIACVDDAARAAVVFLRHYELTGDKASLADARSLLKFVGAMEADDGQFYNFVYSDHTINQEGKTSYKSFGWWAVRGFWSLSMGYRIFRPVDSAFAKWLQRGVERALPNVAKLLVEYPKERSTDGLRIPEWLIYKSGADVSSELLMGLTEYYRATGDAKVRSEMHEVADGLMAMQDGGFARYPYGLHRSWETMWHMWGNGQSEALASAGMVLKDSSMIRSAEREAKGFYTRLLINGYMKELDIARPDSAGSLEQIAYGIRPIALGLLRLSEATDDALYAEMAGLAASWFFGNNIAGARMYDPDHGRCYDGISDSATVNRNSGAESTIEALQCLMEVERNPSARKYMRDMKASHSAANGVLEATFRAPSGEHSTLILDPFSGSVVLREGTQGK